MTVEQLQASEIQRLKEEIKSLAIEVSSLSQMNDELIKRLGNVTAVIGGASLAVRMQTKASRMLNKQLEMEDV
jgi:hypothetical protein